jgi:hypothetical protein
MVITYAMLSISEEVVVWGALLTFPRTKAAEVQNVQLIDRQHGHAEGMSMHHAAWAWAWACSMSMGMKMKHGNDMQHVHGPACSIDMNMQHGMDMLTDMDMQHDHGHAARTWTCSMSSDMDMQKGYGHAERIWTCSMDMDMHMMLVGHIVALF